MIDIHEDFKIIEGKINVSEIKDNQQGVDMKGIELIVIIIKIILVKKMLRILEA